MIALAATGIVFAVLLGRATPGFETNDDVGMMRIASGLLSGQPSEYLVHTNVLIGRCLSAAYTRAPAVNWYAWYLVGVHFAATAALLYLLLKQGRGVLGWLASAVLVLGFEARFLLLLQFTTTASVAALSGILLLLLRPPSADRRLGVLPIVCGAGLLILSAMIRRHSFYLTLMLSTPLVLHALFDRAQRRNLVWFAAAIAVGMAAIAYDQHAYRANPDWASRSRRYDVVRQIVDRGILEYSGPAQAVFDRVGWSANDLAMLRNRYFENAELFSQDKLELVARETVATGWYRDDWQEYLDTYFQDRPAPVRLSLLVLVFALAVAGKGNRVRTVLVAACLALLLVGGLAYLAAYMKLVHRVVLSAIFFSNAALLVFCLPRRTRPALPDGEESQAASEESPQPQRSERSANGPDSSRFRRVAKPALAAIRCVAVLWAGFGLFSALSDEAEQLKQISRTNQRRHAAFDRLTQVMLFDYRGTGREPVFITWANAFPYEWCPPFSPSFRVIDARFIGWGWTTLSPLYDDALRLNRLSGGVPGLLQEPHVFLVYTGYRRKLLEPYLREHFGVSGVVWTDERIYGFTAENDLREAAVAVAKPVALP